MRVASTCVVEHADDFTGSAAIACEDVVESASGNSRACAPRPAPVAAITATNAAANARDADTDTFVRRIVRVRIARTRASTRVGVCGLRAEKASFGFFLRCRTQRRARARTDARTDAQQATSA